MFKNLFRDKRPVTDRQFKKRMGLSKEEFGETESDKTVPLRGSQVSITEFNEIFEGDCYQFESPASGISAVNFRFHDFQSTLDFGNTNLTRVDADQGSLGLGLNDKRSHAHLALGGGDDRVIINGNSERNIHLIEKNGGDFLGLVDPGDGEDKTILMLRNQADGFVHVYGDGEEDSLEIHLRSPDQTVTVRKDPETDPYLLKADDFTVVTYGLDNVKVYPYVEER